MKAILRRLKGILLRLSVNFECPPFVTVVSSLDRMKGDYDDLDHIQRNKDQR